MPSPNTPNSKSREADLRRSSRVENPVPLLVLGTNLRGESFQERTSTLSLNLHGCRYSSRHDYPRESWVTLQVTGTEGAAVPTVRARVCSIQSPQSPRELCQVGVELETPGNIWGVATPPPDWQAMLGSASRTANAASAAAPALDPASDPSNTPPASPPRTGAPAERRAEVTVFPTPITPEPAAPTKDPAAKSERVTFTAEQLLQALQGKLQLAAERAVDTALSARLESSVKQALSKLDDAWKANLRQTEEFSAARLGEVQNRWERELVVYRSRAEEISRRVEALAASSRQSLGELQSFTERIKTDIEPQFRNRIEQFLASANSQLERNAGQLAEQHNSKLAEAAEAAALNARAQLDETVSEARALLSGAQAPAPSGVSEERLESLVNSAREFVLNRTEERLSDLWMQFEQQQDLARRRSDEFAQHLEMLSTQWNEAKALHQKSLAEANAAIADVTANASPERLEPALKIAKEQVFNHLEWRLGEVSGRAEQQHQYLQQRTDELFRRMDRLAADSTHTRTQAEQSDSELRALIGSANNGISAQQLDSILNSARQQLIDHLDGRLGEVSAQFEQQQDGGRQRYDELAERFNAFAADVRRQLQDHQAKVEGLAQEMPSSELTTLDQSADRAAQDFEISAARISDRQLVRLMQQKQALSAEAALELEARASETRAMLQKAANSTLDDFRRRFESHIDLVVAEATERVASSLASLDAESRAAGDARRREMELNIARAAEQSTAEFRSGIKAFLYSCLVAAVSGVDEHAQSTLASLGKDSSRAPLSIEDTAKSGDEPPSGGSASR